MMDWQNIIGVQGGSLPALDLAGNWNCKRYTKIALDAEHFVMVPAGLAQHLVNERLDEAKKWLKEQARESKRKARDENETD